MNLGYPGKIHLSVAWSIFTCISTIMIDIFHEFPIFTFVILLTWLK